MPKWVDLLDSANQKYDNTTSGLTAANAKDAIDEVVAGKENYLGVPAADGYVLSSTVAGVRTWVSAGGAGVVWGDITGTLANQTDLQAALDAKIGEAPADSLPKTRVNDGVTPVWQNERVVPDGGTEGQIIVKNSATEQDAGWFDIPTALSATWTFDSATTANDPGAGEFRLNAATRALTTAIYFSDLTASGIDVGEWLGILKNGQKIIVIQANKPDRAALYEVNGTPTDNTGWWTVPVTHIQDGSGGEFQAGRDVVFDFTGFGGGSIVNWGEIIGTLSDQTDLQAALDAKEDGLGNPTVDGYVLSSTIAGVRSWIAPGSGGSVAWGDITGTLANQTDLQAALDAKAGLASANSFTAANQFLGDFDVGDPGTEAGSVLLDGISYPVVGKFNRFGTGNTAEIVIHRHSTTDGSNLVFSRALSNDATHANVVNGTVLGDIRFTGWGDSSYWTGAIIQATVDGTPGVSDMPTKIDFYTTPDGSFTPVLRGSIRQDGTVEVVGTLTVGAGVVNATKIGNWDTAYGWGDHATAGYEPGLGNPASDGYVLSSTAAGVRSWIPPGGGGVAWGDITGTLSNQTDLQSELDAKLDEAGGIVSTYVAHNAKIVAASAAVDFSTGMRQEINATTYPAITVAPPQTGKPCNLMLNILNSGSITSIAPSGGGSIEWEGGTAPSWAGTTLLALYYDGTAWTGSAVVNKS